MTNLSLFNVSLKINNNYVLKNICINFEKGLNLIAGENGSGKTMLLKCILGINEYDGYITINDSDIKKNKKIIFKTVGYCPVEPRSAILGENLEEDMLFSKKNKDTQKVLNILKRLDMEHLRYKKTNTMSTGEMRITNIATLLFADKDILLLDEPFNGLDYKASITLIKIIKELKKMDKTIIIVSHDLDKFLYYTDCVYIINNGEIVKSGQANDMLNFFENYNIHRPLGTIEDMKWI